MRAGRFATTDQDASGSPHHVGGYAVFMSGIGGVDTDDQVGGTMLFEAEGRFGEDLVQIGLGGAVEGLVAPMIFDDFFAPWFFIRLGLMTFRAGSIDDTFVFGLVSPRAEGGLMIGFGDDMDDEMMSFEIGAGAEYDLRFTGPESEGIWFVNGGLRFWFSDFYW